MERPGPPSRILTLLALGVSVASILGTAPRALGAERSPERQVVLVVVPELGYGAALADPLVSELAQAGGVGLLTTSGGADLAARTALAIGAGRPMDDAPAGTVRVALVGEGVQVDLGPIVEHTGQGDLGALGSAMAEAGLRVAYVAPGQGSGATAAALAAMDAAGRIPLAWLPDAGAGARDALAADLVVGPSPDLVRFALERSGADEILVIVAGAGASPGMRERGETVNAIVLGRGAPEELLDPEGPPRGLTSGTTRRGGVVAEVDVAPTILGFLGVEVPPGMVGSDIRVEDEPPTGLHRRFLDLRAVVRPVGLGGLAFALVLLAIGLVVLFAPGGPRRLPRLSTGSILACSLLIAMLPTSWLPSLRPGIVAATLVGTSAGVTAIARLRARGDARRAIATVAALGLALVVADAAMGWRSELTPMLGGGVLDGERFFGLGNAYAGIVVAGALLTAARLRPRRGQLLLVLAAALAGLPSVGADLGGCLTLAAATALWVGLPRWKLGPRTWALVAVALATAGVYVAITGRLLGGATHLSRPPIADGLLVAFVARLLENVRTTSATPAAWLLVVGLAAWFALIRRPPAVLRPVLEADVRWWNALLALTISGLIGWVLNDTYGLAGSAFAFASAAVLAPALRGRTGATG